MPRSWTATAAGEQVERREEGERALERWRMHVPHPSYLVTLVAGEFASKQGSLEGAPLSYMAAPKYEPMLAACFAVSINLVYHNIQTLDIENLDRT